MITRKFVRRTAFPLAAVVMLSIGAQFALTQTTTPPPVPIPDVGLPAIKNPNPPPPPARPTVEALLDQLDQLRKQRAELDAKEKAVLGQLSEVMKCLQDRMTKLGVVAPTVPPPAAKEDTTVPRLPPARDDSKAFDLPLPKK